MSSGESSKVEYVKRDGEQIIGSEHWRPVESHLIDGSNPKEFSETARVLATVVLAKGRIILASAPCQRATEPDHAYRPETGNSVYVPPNPPTELMLLHAHVSSVRAAVVMDPGLAS